MVLPKKIKIGGFSYEIKFVDSLGEDAGARIDQQKLIIEIEKSNQDYMMQSFIHELLHAVNMELKEETVEFLAMSLFQIFKDNQQVFEWFTKGGGV